MAEPRLQLLCAHRGVSGWCPGIGAGSIAAPGSRSRQHPVRSISRVVHTCLLIFPGTTHRLYMRCAAGSPSGAQGWSGEVWLRGAEAAVPSPRPLLKFTPRRARKTLSGDPAVGATKWGGRDVSVGWLVAGVALNGPVGVPKGIARHCQRLCSAAADGPSPLTHAPAVPPLARRKEMPPT